MQFPQTSEYALRAMARLAAQKRGEPLRAKDLSQDVGIPLPYLSKILRRLVTAGLLTSEKGHGGGFILAKAPSRIKFSDILVAVDHGVEPNRCVFGWGKCNSRNPCPLHDTWSQLNLSFNEWARTTSLADIDPDIPFQNLKSLRTQD